MEATLYMLLINAFRCFWFSLSVFSLGGCRSWCGPRSAEEENVQEVQLQGCRFGCASGHVHWWACQALSRPCSEKVVLLRNKPVLLVLHFSVCQAVFESFLLLWNGRFQRGLKRKPMALIKKLRKAVSVCFPSIYFLFLDLAIVALVDDRILSISY